MQLSLVLERLTRAVRDADAIVEAAGATLLLQAGDGTTDLYCFRVPPGAEQGELVLVRDAGGPGGAPAEESLVVPELTRCQFARAASLPAGGPAGAAPARPGIACVLERKAGGRSVRVGTVVHCRNGLWERDLR